MGKDVCTRCGGPLRVPPGGGEPTCPRCTVTLDLAGETRTALETTPPPPSRIDLRGRTIGNYTILAEVSRGAMGVVYKARQHQLDRIVAIKVLIAGEMATEAQVARFRREARAAAKLRHPAIVPIHEVGVFEGKHYYTMDFIEGRNLSSLIRERKITIRRALDIAAQVADALDYAHRQGVIHRDIKPSNIMIDNDGRVHITDFGLAKQLGSDPKFTRTGTAIGTPAYMPPEQASGESHRVDHRADIYSLGAVLYEMLTRRPPFSGETMMNTLMQVLNDEPAPPKRLNPRIHRDIQTIVLKAMEKRPERRYATMKAFAADIRAFIAGESISARPAGPFYRAWRFLRRHNSAALAAVAVITVAMTAAAVILDIRSQSEARIRAARETGKREGAAVAAKRLQLQEKPTIKTVFDDEFRAPDLPKRWVVEEGSWLVRASEGLEVAPAPHAAIRTKARFTGNVRVEFEAMVPPAPEGSARQEALVGCFLGSAWPRSYRFSFGSGGRGGPRVVVMNRRQVVAEADCAPLQPGTRYYVELERTPLGVELRVESDGEEPPVHLAYKELTLPQQLPREFSAGLFTKRTHLLVRRFKVDQEFPPAKLSPIKAAEGLFRDGNVAEARKQFAQIAQGYEGRYEGLAAMVGLALCDEAERRYAQALKALARIEALAPRIHHEELPALLDRSRLRSFFVNSALNNYSEAMAALGRLAASGGHVEQAWMWHFPKFLDQMLNNRAYDQALALLSSTVFGPARLSLHDAIAALRASTLQARVSRRVRGLAEAFCGLGRYERVKEIYDAWPTPELAAPLAKAALAAIQQGKLEGALALLAFCHGEELRDPGLSKAAVELGNAFVGRGEFLRVATLYEVFPEPALESVFRAATRGATEAGKLDDAFTMLDETIRSFPEHAETLLATDGAASRLAEAYLAKGDFLKLVDIHALFSPEHDTGPLAAKFVKATREAIKAGEAGAALRLLEHCRISFGVLDPELAKAAAQLVQLYDQRGDYAKVADTLLAYPNEALAPAVATAIAHAVAGEKLHDAIVLLGHYARMRYPLGNLALGPVAKALATLDPDDDEEDAGLLDDYRRAYELYESPVATAAFALALGDAYVRAGKLEPAFAQYQEAGGAEGLLRAGCLAIELGLRERANALWGRLRKVSDRDEPFEAAAELMLGETSVERFRKSVEGKWPAPLAHYLVGLRLWSEADDAAEGEFAKARVAAGEWFGSLAARPRSPLAPDVPAFP